MDKIRCKIKRVINNKSEYLNYPTKLLKNLAKSCKNEFTILGKLVKVVMAVFPTVCKCVKMFLGISVGTAAIGGKVPKFG